MKFSDSTYGLLLCLVGVLVLTPDTLLLRSVGNVPNPTVLFYRFGLDGITVLTYLSAVHKGNIFLKFKSLGLWGLLAGTLLSTAHLFFTLGIQKAHVANVLVIFASNPMFSALFSWMFLNETIKEYTFVAMLTCIGGIVYIFYDQMGGSNTNDVVGNCFALISTIAMGTYFVLVRFMEIQHPDGTLDVVFCNVIAGFIIVIVSLMMGANPAGHVAIRGIEMMWLLVQGVLVLPISFSLLTIGPSYITAPEVSMILLLETVLGPLWVWLAGYEDPPVKTIYGGSVIVATLLVHSLIGMFIETDDDEVNYAEVMAVERTSVDGTHTPPNISAAPLNSKSRCIDDNDSDINVMELAPTMSDSDKSSMAV